MLDTIITLLAICSLTFAIRNIDGPFGVCNWMRNKLMSNKFVGVFFYQLLSCPYCSGTWSGVAIYMLQQSSWHWNEMVIWGLAGGMVSLLMEMVLNKLSGGQNEVRD